MLLLGAFRIEKLRSLQSFISSLTSRNKRSTGDGQTDDDDIVNEIQ